MDNQKDIRKDEAKTPDAFGNDKLQGDDMPRAGKPGGTDIFVGDDELKQDEIRETERDDYTAGIP